jgi:molecular chaperone DnaK (HSP70)
MTICLVFLLFSFQEALYCVKAVLESAKTASGMTVDQIDSVEVVGGASRVPWFKAMCSEAFGGKE